MCITYINFLPRAATTRIKTCPTLSHAFLVVSRSFITCNTIFCPFLLTPLCPSSKYVLDVFVLFAHIVAKAMPCINFGGNPGGKKCVSRISKARCRRERKMKILVVIADNEMLEDNYMESCYKWYLVN